MNKTQISLCFSAHIIEFLAINSISMLRNQEAQKGSMYETEHFVNGYT